MRRVAIAIFAIVTVAVLTYAVWVSKPALKDQEIVEQALVSFEKARSEDQSKASDPEVNGFLNETLQPLWGAGHQKHDDKPEVEQVVEAWNLTYSEPGTGKAIDHKNLLDSNDADYLKKRSELEKYLPVFKEALNTEEFIAPAQGPARLLEPTADLAACRTLVQALCGYGDSLVAEQKPDEAAEIYESCLNLSANLQGQGSILSEMIGVAVVRICLDSILDNFHPDTALSPEEMKQLGRAIVPAAPSEESFRLALAGEVARFSRHIQEVKNGSENVPVEGSTNQTALSTLPGLVEREERLYLNNSAEMLQAYDSDQDDQFLGKIQKAGFGSWLKGETSYMAAIVTPNYSRARLQVRTARKFALGAAVSYAMLACRRETGEWLDSSALEQTLNLEKESLASEGIAVGEGRILISLTADENTAMGSGPGVSWVELKDDSLEFVLDRS